MKTVSVFELGCNPVKLSSKWRKNKYKTNGKRNKQ